MISNLKAAINQICAEKGIEPEIVYSAIENSFIAAYRKDFGNKEQNIRVSMDEKTDFASVFQIMKVVEKVEDENTEMTLENAKKINKEAEIGQEVEMDVTPLEYGRIAAMAAKQVIIQQLREAENNMVKSFYNDKIGTVIPGSVKRIEENGTEIDIERTTTFLDKERMIPGENLRNGQRIKVYVEKIIETGREPKVLISRTHPDLVRYLLAEEIPEIGDEIVEVKAIAREPGIRTKIAVSSNDESIDPVGSCVGQKGIRIQNVMNEINNEYVDVIEWVDDPEELLKRALSPAKVTAIRIKEENGRKRAKVYVEEDQRSLAIGKNGQNVRLASLLVNMEVDILNIPDLEEALAKEQGIEISQPNEKETESEASALLDELQSDEAEEKVEEIKEEKTEEKVEEIKEDESDGNNDKKEIKEDVEEKKIEEKVEEKKEELKDGDK